MPKDKKRKKHKDKNTVNIELDRDLFEDDSDLMDFLADLVLLLGDYGVSVKMDTGLGFVDMDDYPTDMTLSDYRP